MTFYSECKARAEAALASDPAFSAAVDAFKTTPSEDNFRAVCEHVAFAASPNEEVETHFRSAAFAGSTTEAFSGSMAADFLYHALTQEIVGVNGRLDALRKREANQWTRALPALRRAGVPFAS